MKKYALLVFLPFLLTALASAQTPDTEAVYNQAKKHLLELVNIDTSKSNPDETAAVRYLYKELNKHHIDWDFLSPRQGSANLLARIKGTDPNAKPLLLISHLDTQDAGDGWTYPPFKPTLEDGRIYGLGVTDAKNYTAMHLALFTQIKDAGIAPKRDIIFLATSGEETGSDTGMKWLGETQWDKINPGFALNEGGGIIKNEPLDQTLVFAEAGTKMYMDIKITASGEAAHSSLPVGENAVYRLSQALARLPQFNPPARLTATTKEFLRRIAPTQDEDAQTTISLLLNGKPDQQQMAADIMAQDPFFRTQLKDTINPVNISSGPDTGAATAEASAIVNVRLLPGTNPDEFFEALKNFLGEEDYLTLEILERPQLPFPQPMDGSDELFTSISRTAQRMWPRAVTVPGMSPASGDSEFLRRLGVITYGLGPAMNSQGPSSASPHAADEYIAENDYREQVLFFTALVYDFAFDKDILPPAQEPQEQSPAPLEAAEDQPQEAK